MNDMRRLLVIDDDEIHREVVHRMLGEGYELHNAETGTAALELLPSVNFDCVLLDYRLPDYTGLELLPYMVARHLPVVMFTSLASEKLAVKAMNNGAQDYLRKDRLTRENLSKAIDTAIRKNPWVSPLDHAVGHNREPSPA